MSIWEPSQTAYVIVCARKDTEVVWNDGENADFDVITDVTTEACGAPGQFVVTSSIFKKTSGAHEFKVELVSTSCESGEKPTLSATCECADSDSCKMFLTSMENFCMYVRHVGICRRLGGLSNCNQCMYVNHHLTLSVLFV